MTTKKVVVFSLVAVASIASYLFLGSGYPKDHGLNSIKEEVFVDGMSSLRGNLNRKVAVLQMVTLKTVKLSHQLQLMMTRSMN